jgi:primosomal protein N'
MDRVLASFQQNHPKMKCNYCGKKGHMSDTCTINKRTKNATIMTVGTAITAITAAKAGSMRTLGVG